MKIIRNRIIPFKGFSAINLFGIVFARQEVVVNEDMLRHERIHTIQMKELGYLLFYLIYVTEWIFRLFLPGNAYRKISFEREAYSHEKQSDYLSHRMRFAQWRRNKH